MFELQALQADGAWYTISTHASRRQAEDAMRERACWRNGAVRYRIISQPAFVDTCVEHAYGTTTRLSFQIRVF